MVDWYRKTMDGNDKNKHLRDILAQIDLRQMREQIKGAGLLFACAFALFFLFAATYELIQVYNVASWRPQPARVVSVSQERSASAPHRRYWRYVISLAETGEQITTSDVRPGDLPIDVLGWSTSDADAARYQAGQRILVFRSPEGGKVFLEQGGYGLMSFFLGASIAFWIFILLRARRKSQTRP